MTYALRISETLGIRCLAFVNIFSGSILEAGDLQFLLCIAGARLFAPERQHKRLASSRCNVSTSIGGV